MMSVTGRLRTNPLWSNEIIPQERAEDLLEAYPLDGSTPPEVLHYDLLMMKCSRKKGLPRIYTYRSDRWNAYLLTCRDRRPGENDAERMHANAQRLSSYLSVPASDIDVCPTDDYMVSVKPHGQHGYLVVYVFQFCTVWYKNAGEFPTNTVIEIKNDSFTAKGKWHDMEELLRDKESFRVNGDVVATLHQRFGNDLAGIPDSLPDCHLLE
jgi:hypothetical protein